MIEKIASHDKIGLEFSTINTIKSEIRTEINSYLQKINEYIDYIKKRVISINQEMDTDDLKNTHEEKLFEFKANIVVDLLSLELNRIILFDKIKFDETKNSINKFIAGEFDSINPTLNLNVSDKNHAYYLIHSLQNHSVFDLKDIKNITINGEGFVANHCSKAITEINKKKRTNNKKSKEFFLVKDEIDSLIKANLIEIR